jgi:hypothetical protein
MSKERVSLRKSLSWGLIAFGAVLTAVIGVRLERFALTVVVGVVCGVGASLPISILIVVWMRKRNRNREMEIRRSSAQAPPVVVVAPPHSTQPGQRSKWPGN